MKSDYSAESWLKFFTSAGVPMESSRTYAATFSKNEIKLDMLPEIRKEYLVDMGITLLGHIIAILRHAKVYEENVTTTTLSPAPVKYGPAAKPVPKEKPVVKTLPLRIYNEKQNTSETSTAVKKTVAPVESRQRAVGTSTVQNNVSSTQTSSLQVADKVLPSKKKDSETNQKMKISSIVAHSTNKKKTSEETPIGLGDEAVTNKGKVFERLGIEVTDEPSYSPGSNSSNESVFSRLGGKTSPITYSQSRSPVKVSYKPISNGVDSSSDYPTVKRVVQNGNKSKCKPIMFTMRADEAEAESAAAALARQGSKRTRSPSPSISSLGAKVVNLKKNIKTRLGRISRSVSPSSTRIKEHEGPIAFSSVGHDRSEKSVKARLGLSDFDSVEERNGILGRGSGLSRRSSKEESIALSSVGYDRSEMSVKARLGLSDFDSVEERNGILGRGSGLSRRSSKEESIALIGYCF